MNRTGYKARLRSSFERLESRPGDRTVLVDSRDNRERLNHFKRRLELEYPLELTPVQTTTHKKGYLEGHSCNASLQFHDSGVCQSRE